MLHYSTSLNVLTRTPDQVRFLQENLGAQRYLALRMMDDDETGRDRAMQFRIPNAATPDPGIFHTPRQRALVSWTLRSRRLWDLVGAKYLVIDQEIPSFQGMPVAYRKNGVVIYENPQAFPLAFLARQVAGAGTPDQVMGEMLNGKADLRDVALVEQDPSPLPAPRPDQPPGAVLGFEPSQGEYRMRTRTEGAQQLLLTVTYHPEWRCAVDGQEAPIAETDFGFMSVRVPAGEHEVRWWFDPVRSRQGLAGTIVGAVIAMGVLVAVPILRRRSAPKAGP
jgi:hypothetical protein